MYIHICMYVCMYVCMYACVYVYMHVCVYMYVCMYVCMFAGSVVQVPEYWLCHLMDRYARIRIQQLLRCRRRCTTIGMRVSLMMQQDVCSPLKTD